MGEGLFFSKEIFVGTLITYFWTLILVSIFLIWIFIVSVISMIVLKFLKIHCQYGLNVYWEGNIDLDVIFNYITELLFPYFTSYKVFVLN